jgi:hypothetical protein
MAETMSYDDCAVIAKCLETAGSSSSRRPATRAVETTPT